VSARAATVTLALVVAALPSCADRELPPLAETLVIVDTDLPVPLLAGRMRIDLYTREGDWYESRDVALPDRSNWPASFSVFSPDTENPRAALLRLRVYAESKLRDYRGERFAARPELGLPGAAVEAVAEPPGNAPRLMRDGNDITPSSEPQPLLAVDRLVSIPFTPGVRGSSRIVMRGSCIGTTADLAQRKTCVDTENVRADVTDVVLDRDLSVPPASVLVGTFGAVTQCNVEARVSGGASLLDDEVCVPGGTFILGDARTAGAGEGTAAPERIAIIPPLLVDRFEVSVARWRAVTRRKFRSPDASPVENEETDNSRRYCTWSETPGERESHALTCVTRGAARAFCAFHGGDLLTEAQFEYVALAAGREHKTRYPWGDQPPTCARAVYGRDPDADGLVGLQQECLGAAPGPRAADAAAGPDGDVTPGAGIVNLGGGVLEWLQDSFHLLTDNCWAASSILDPVCLDDTARARAFRGGSWKDGAFSLEVTRRIVGIGTPALFATGGVGFRCARPGRLE